MRTALRKARLKAGLTQSELAHQVGLRRASYTNIEKGHKNPSVSTALRIARALNRPVEELFADELYAFHGARSGRRAMGG
ncbi:MAG: putative transcriptional regulator [Moorella sp. (in: firmicutes)]|uniref:helix-turn-helix transcriptional regulator n=1 Tax=unclassified Neomoorella TaxID=2676739 RepID=UPI0010FFB071|nr:MULTISPECIES: helix-turn-helix transcriptional regulator [unclassified Moorella (in: firmicutes)]MDK2816818.1 putative transcriptional regulator [Moorella sp. (in: firmicutes)]GEA14921.1 transcriptional regulator [Moorella sp. E308F]GEA17650.1 transcriptional regulator [Moorella sp. E306M]